MKKIMVSFVVLISVFLLAGCGTGQQGTTPVGTRPPTVQATGTTSGTASATPTPSAGPNPLINALWMSDATTGWARTTTRLILHTTDGGTSWQDVTPAYPAGSTGQLPPAFAFLSGTVAWVAVSEKQQLDGTIPNVLFRTSDGGHTWQEAMLPRSGLGVSQVQFVNAQDGWVLASFGGVAAGSQAVDLFRSTDGGQTWSTVARAPGSLPLGGDKSGMGWASATTGRITGTIATPNPILLYRTQDRGVSWQPQSLPSSSFSPVQTLPPVFFSATEGLLPVTFFNGEGSGLTVYATHDGGATWSSSTPLSMAGSVWGFLTMQQGWVVGANGTTLNETSDGGQHWTPITPSANFRNISQLDFVSAQEGWAISTATPAAPVLLKTMDGGQTWVQVSSSCGTWNVVPSPNRNGSSALRAVATVSATDVWAVGGGQLAGSKTLIEHWDGAHWSVVTSPNPGSIYDILDGVTAVSESSVWAVGYDSNTGGVTQTLTEHWDGARWSVVTSPNPSSVENTLFGVAAISASSVWAVGITTSTSQRPLVEHWNGSHWSVVTSPSPGSKGNSLSGVAVVSASSVWAVGDFMNNGSQQALVEHWNGTSWQVVPSPSVGTSSTFWAVGAVSAKDVWAVGDTANGNQGFQTLTEQWNGSRWSVVTSPSPGSTNTSLNGVAAISESSVWAVGNAESNTLTEHDQC